jgi:glutamate carboxypeptidase
MEVSRRCYPRWLRCALVPVACLWLEAARAQSLSPAERALAQSVAHRLDEEVATLERVVNINSGTLNVAGVREVGRVFQQDLEALGFTTRWVSMPEPMHRAGHLFAERLAPAGATGKRVLLVGHLDTVFEGAGHRFQRDGDAVRGAGVADMKGGDVVILFALRALHAAGCRRGPRCASRS